jgi:hypothetical protein
MRLKPNACCIKTTFPLVRRTPKQTHKIIPKSMKNHPKSKQNGSKNLPKRHSKNKSKKAVKKIGKV